MRRPIAFTAAAASTALVASGLVVAATHAATDSAGTSAKLASSARLPVLRGYVGNDETITISKRRVPPGRYNLVVVDRSSNHNWHIKGSVGRRTSEDGSGTWRWTVRLREGRYRIVCDPHADDMVTSIRVTRG